VLLFLYRKRGISVSGETISFFLILKKQYDTYKRHTIQKIKTYPQGFQHIVDKSNNDRKDNLIKKQIPQNYPHIDRIRGKFVEKIKICGKIRGQMWENSVI